MVQEFDKKITQAKVTLYTVEEFLGDKNVQKANQEVDAVTTATFGHLKTQKSERRLWVFRTVKVKPEIFEARLCSFLKNSEEWNTIIKTVKKILNTSGELLKTEPRVRAFLFKVPDENIEIFKDFATKKDCIFRFS